MVQSITCPEMEKQPWSLDVTIPAARSKNPCRTRDMTVPPPRKKPKVEPRHRLPPLRVPTVRLPVSATWHPEPARRGEQCLGCRRHYLVHSALARPEQGIADFHGQFTLLITFKLCKQSACREGGEQGDPQLDPPSQAQNVLRAPPPSRPLTWPWGTDQK